MTSDSVTYDEKTGRIVVKGAVDFEDPKLRVRSDDGHYDINGAASFDQANFQLMDRNGRGFAKDINVLPDGKLSMAQACAIPAVRSETKTDAAGLVSSVSTPRRSKAWRAT